MFNLWRKYIKISFEDSSKETETRVKNKLLSDLCWYADLNGKACYIEYAKCKIQERWEFEKKKPLFDRRKINFKNAKATLKEIGLPKNSWFVTLHVRDSGFYTGKPGSKDNIDDYRDANITTYFEAIEEITKRGGYVVRAGDPKMKTTKKMPGLIDYAHHPKRSNLCDMYLFANCRFFIGTSSGPILNPFLFGVPVVGTNYAPIAGRLHGSKSIVIHKKIYSDEKKRFLKIQECLQSAFGRGWASHHYQANNLRLIDNTSEEIKDAVIEMIETLDKAIQYSAQQEKLQNQINSLYNKYSGYGSSGRIGRRYLANISNLGLLN